MPSRSPHWYPGTPAAWCLAYDTVPDLSRLVPALHGMPYIWLDTARTHAVTGRYSFLGWDPWLMTSRWDGDPLEAMQAVVSRYPGPRRRAGLPVLPGFFLVLGYELNRWIERLPHPKRAEVPTPELVLAGMRMVVVIDHLTQQSWCVSVVDPDGSPRRAAREARQRLEHWDNRMAGRAPADEMTSTAPVELSPQMRPRDYEQMVARAQDAIAQGEIFQANVAQSFSGTWQGPVWPLYAALRRINPSPFACLAELEHFAIVSCSPERLVRAQDGEVSTRPIAGTRARGHTAADDWLTSMELLLSEKERAEHIMLVDLERNDLGRICRAGSVSVDELMVLEDYSHVKHIVSNVRGKVRPGVRAADVIRAVFPGGTITGCPKVRCMELIHEYEPVARGFYTGSAGWLGFDGSMDLNILIRTMVIRDGRLSFHVGAGIVADSVPQREYHETLAKAEALMSALRASVDTRVSHGMAH